MECDEQPELINKTTDLVEFLNEEKYQTDCTPEHDGSSKSLKEKTYSSYEWWKDKNYRWRKDKSIENTNIEDEKEPLFVEDRTNTFERYDEILFNKPFDMFDTSNMYTEHSLYLSRACWNCSLTENHSYQNCPEVRSNAKIYKNRKRFYLIKNELMSSGQLPQGRYFAYRPNDVYQKIDQNATTINGLFSEMSLSAVCSEGNISNGIINEKNVYANPGFNTPCPDNFVDDHTTYSCPEYNPDQSLYLTYERLNDTNFDNNFIPLYINVKTELVSRSNDVVLNDESNSQFKTNEEDLSINTNLSSLDSGEITDKNSDQSDAEFPLNTTEKSKTEKIVAKIERCTPGTCSDDNKFECETRLSRAINSENGSTSTRKETKRKFGDVIFEILGTPVLDHNYSSYKKRPSHEQFAKGMVDRIKEENSPNAVGTFQKIKDILKDARIHRRKSYLI